MSARHSIGLRLIRWGECLLDHVSQKPVDGLCGSEVHAQARANDGLRRGVCINDALSERQINGAVMVPRLAYEIDMGDGAIIPRNHPGLISYLEGVRFNPNHIALTHKKPPIGEDVDPSNLKAMAAGVEP